MRVGEDWDILTVLDDARMRLGSEDFYWVAFQQLWGKTSMGFGGIGGNAMTTAQTYVVISVPAQRAFVYFSSRFAYEISPLGNKFFEAVDKRQMPSVDKSQTIRETSV